jgi:RNA polymerase sigma-70 factor (ECF subfamily)
MIPQLLKDAAGGDRKAQYQLYRRCFNVLMSVCMRYRRSEKEAVAMVNEGFLKIIRYLDKYKPETPFEAWIRRIMINTLIDDFRKNRKVTELIEHRDFSDSEGLGELIDFNEADQLFDAAQLEALIRALPPVSGKVFNLFAIDGYSHTEISEMLDISVGTSKWHVSFARQRLQEMLARLNQSLMEGEAAKK